MLTDLEYTLENLRGNVRENSIKYSSSSDQSVSVEGDHREIFVRPLDWFDASTYVQPSNIITSGVAPAEEARNWDIILGAGEKTNINRLLAMLKILL